MTGKVKYIYGFLTVLLLACSAGDALGQHYFGVRGGFGSGTGSRFYPKRAESASLWGLYHGGVSWKYYTSQKYVGGTEVDLIYMQQGYKEYGKPYSFNNGVYDGVDSTAYYKRTVNSVMVPLMWQPHIYMFNRNLRIFLNAGVTFSYNISSTYEHGSAQEGVIYSEGKYPLEIVRDNRWGYGLVAGAGLGYSVGRVEVLAEFRYYIGYSDIRKNWNKYYEDGNTADVNTQGYVMNRLRTPLDGLQASVGIYYRFGRKGILSPPSPKVEQRMREIEQKRLRRKGLWVDPPDEYDIMEDGTEVEQEVYDSTGNTDDPGTIIIERGDIPEPSPEEEEVPPATDGVLSVFIR